MRSAPCEASSHGRSVTALSRRTRRSGLQKEHETARTRVLSDDETRTLINAFDQTRYGRALRLLFLTALRRDEVLGLKWSWIDMEKGVLTIPDIRRTVADALLNRIGAPPWIVDHVVLGHARPKLLRTYMPTLPLGEARDALEKWGDQLMGILKAGNLKSDVTTHLEAASVAAGTHRTAP